MSTELDDTRSSRTSLVLKLWSIDRQYNDSLNVFVILTIFEYYVAYFVA